MSVEGCGTAGTRSVGLGDASDVELVEGGLGRCSRLLTGLLLFHFR